MVITNEQQAADLFMAALDHEPGDRASFLDRACADSPALRSRVEQLLAVDSRHTLFLQPSMEVAGRPGGSAASIAAGAVIGHFEIVRPIGAGAMGMVYEARQNRPSRTVALKLMSLAVIDPSARRRFEHEAEIMARLHHPGIAQVYEAGVYENRMPWFAMEHIAGAQSLREHVSQRHMDRRSILQIFVQICDAVHYAHQHGVIHRDLKPDNILVNADGQPKIIDFGVARLMEADIGAATMHTQAGQMVGTPRYMSPEQCVGPTTSLIDLRSDVYTLGVILYELLTGALPYPVENGSLMQVAHTIVQQEPRLPSSLNRTLAGDLEIILLKSLEKELSRRYQSALELADDVRRYLASEPIMARQASTLYVLSKRLRRYRVAAMFSAGMLVGVIAFALYAAWQARTQHELAVKAQDASRAAQQASAAAEAARGEAQRQATHSQSVSEFVTRFMGLGDPDNSHDRNMTMHEGLRLLAEEIDEAFVGDLTTAAVLHLTVGRAFASFGDSLRADFHLRRTIDILEGEPATRPEVLYDAMSLLQIVRHDINSFDRFDDRDRIEHLGCSIIRQKHPGLADALTTMHAASMARPTDPDACKANKARVLEFAHASLTPDDHLWLIVADQLESASHSIAWRGAQWRLACEYIEHALAIELRLLGETNFRVDRTRQELIQYTLRDHRAVDAEELSQQAIRAVQQTLPPDHWYIGALQRQLGQSLLMQDRLAEAESVLLEGLSRLSAGEGDRSSHCINLLVVLVDLYERKADEARAAEHRRRLASTIAGSTYECSKASMAGVLGPEHAKIEDSMMRVLALKPLDKQDEVRSALQRCLATCQDTLAIDDPVLACVSDVLDRWGDGYRLNGGDIRLLEPMYQYSLSIDNTGKQRAMRADSVARWSLGLILLETSRLKEAEAHIRECMANLEAGRVVYKRPLSNYQRLLGDVLTRQGRFDEAERELLPSYQWLLLHEGPAGVNTRLAESRLLSLYVVRNRLDQAEQLAVQAVQRALEQQPPNGALLDHATWNIVRESCFSASLYGLALQTAQRVVKIDKANGPWMNTRAAAEYRCGQYAQALGTLIESDRLNGGRSLEDAAFMSMTRWRLGERTAAQQDLARFRVLFDSATPAVREQSQALLREAEALIEAPAGSTPTHKSNPTP